MGPADDPRHDVRVRGQASHKKGLEFETAFREVMLVHMGFATVLQRAKRKGRLVEGGYECDLLGTWGSGRYTLVAALGMCGCFVLGMTAIGLTGEPNPNVLEIRDWIAGIAEPIVGVAAFWPTWFVMIALSALLWHRGGRKERFSVLVECRNREENIDVDYVHTVSGRASDIQWHSNEIWIVASVGFAPDAVQLATAKNIHCIVFKPQGSVTLLNPRVPTRSRLRGLDLVTDPVHTWVAVLDLKARA